MTSWLDPLRVELDLSPGPLQFFFRDDDAGWDDDALFAMCDRFAGRASLDVAAIPTAMSPGLAKALLSRSDHVFVHQHGYAHINHRGMGKKCEFGDDRPAVDVQQDLRHGAAILTSLFGDSLQPIFTPPWNRCSEEAARAAATAGMRILSRDRGEEPFGIDALCEVPVAVDWVRHRAELGHTIASACAGTPIETPVGIMLHHAVFDRSDLERIDALLQLLSTHNNAQLCSIADVAHPRVGHLGVGL